MPRLVYGFRSYFPGCPKITQRNVFVVCITAELILEIFNLEGKRRLRDKVWSKSGS